MPAARGLDAGAEAGEGEVHRGQRGRLAERLGDLRDRRRVAGERLADEHDAVGRDHVPKHGGGGAEHPRTLAQHPVCGDVTRPCGSQDLLDLGTIDDSLVQRPSRDGVVCRRSPAKQPVWPHGTRRRNGSAGGSAWPRARSRCGRPCRSPAPCRRSRSRRRRPCSRRRGGAGRGTPRLATAATWLAVATSRPVRYGQRVGEVSLAVVDGPPTARPARPRGRCAPATPTPGCWRAGRPARPGPRRHPRSGSGSGRPPGRPARTRPTVVTRFPTCTPTTECRPSRSRAGHGDGPRHRRGETDHSRAALVDHHADRAATVAALRPVAGPGPLVWPSTSSHLLPPVRGASRSVHGPTRQRSS